MLPPSLFDVEFRLSSGWSVSTAVCAPFEIVAPGLLNEYEYSYRYR